MVVGWAGWQLVGYFVVAVDVALRGAYHVAAPLVVDEGWCFLRILH